VAWEAMIRRTVGRRVRMPPMSGGGWPVRKGQSRMSHPCSTVRSRCLTKGAGPDQVTGQRPNCATDAGSYCMEWRCPQCQDTGWLPREGDGLGSAIVLEPCDHRPLPAAPAERRHASPPRDSPRPPDAPLATVVLGLMIDHMDIIQGVFR
jgi:hypothetical protein